MTNDEIYSYGFTEDEIDIQMMTREFIRKELPWEKIKECDEKSEVPMDVYKKCAEMGLTSITLPETIGGGGMGQVANSIVCEEIAYQDIGFATTVGANSLAYTPVDLWGTQEQKEYFGKYLVEGGSAAFCLTEADAGSDVASLRTTAVKEGDEWVINGTKCFITNGGIADIYVVFAVTTPDAGTHGMSAFIVERNREGISIGKEEDKMGIRLSNTVEVVFDNVRIPAKNLLGKENSGFKIAMSVFDITRPAGVGAATCGMMRSAIDKCLEYATQRFTFGQPILQNQMIQTKLANMEIQTQASRALAYKVARMIDDGKISGAMASASKTMTSDAAVQIALDAIQIFGGNGYSKEYPIEIMLRNAKIGQIFEGTNEVQRMVIIKNMLKSAGLF